MSSWSRKVLEYPFDPAKRCPVATHPFTHPQKLRIFSHILTYAAPCGFQATVAGTAGCQVSSLVAGAKQRPPRIMVLTHVMVARIHDSCIMMSPFLLPASEPAPCSSVPSEDVGLRFRPSHFYGTQGAPASSVISFSFFSNG